MRRPKRTLYTDIEFSPIHDVFILGAGFSRAVDSSMPLTRELTNLVIEGLRDLIDETRFETIPFLREDFEKGLSYLAEPQPWLSESERLQNRSLFLDISDAIHQVLVNAQNELLRKHPVCPSWLLCLVHRMYAERAFVITLNYDTLLEMAASEFCFGRENTFISDFLRPFKFPATEGQVYAESPKSFQLLKLHGSLHWTYPGTEEYFGQGIEDKTLPRWSVAAGDKRSFALEDGRVPLLIPPTLNKSKFFDNEKVRSMWKKASMALSQARRVFCMGYSLPEGDLLMRFLLYDSRPWVSRRIPFWLVNSDGETIKHYEKALPPWYDLCNSYVCDKDYEVVPTFATAFVRGDLDRLNDISVNPAPAIRKYLQTALSGSRSQKDYVDDSEFQVERVDDCGLLLPDAKGGVHLLPWKVCDEILQAASTGRYDHDLDNSKRRSFVETTFQHAWDRQIFNVLVNTGALETTDLGGKVRVRPGPDLITGEDVRGLRST